MGIPRSRDRSPASVRYALGLQLQARQLPGSPQDVVAYHAGAGPEVNGALQTYTVDIIGGHCGGSSGGLVGASPVIPGDPSAARWHNRFRF